MDEKWAFSKTDKVFTLADNTSRYLGKQQNNGRTVDNQNEALKENYEARYELD